MKKTKIKTINLEVDDVWVDVEYDYTPAEAEITYYGDGSGYPGCGAKVDIYAVKIGKTDISNIISDYVFEELENQIYKAYED